LPLKEEIWKAYKVYFTHREFAPEKTQEIGRIEILPIKLLKPFYKLFLQITGLRRAEKKWRKRSDELYLGEAIPDGRLLDVGCGKGDFLARMRRQGWNVEGLEVDPDAVDMARAEHGLTIHLGDLESRAFPGDSFDAITMNHVIEHIHDPVSLIRECRRVLRPGGRLVLVTPNVNSLAHWTFKRDCSHLDPPRHLHLFSKGTLRECAARAGFRSIDSWYAPGYAEGSIGASVDLAVRSAGKSRHQFHKWVEASYLKVRAYFRYFVKEDEEAGEDLILVARKDA
jgi:2-polyprenyl-3-methyl-5-hydroxy-6-metoxy-1,4-benzoquinol methylase